jgi:hypothetical protein
MHTNLLSKADYKGLKEDEVDLGTQRLKAVDLNGTQSSIEPWTQLDSAHSERKRMAGSEVKGKTDGNFAFGVRHRSV